MEYGTNLFFDPIPMEMLYTAVTQPKVSVSVNGLSGLCTGLNCGYAYVAQTAEITGQALSALDVVISGTNLPTTDISVVLGGASCGEITGDDTRLTCTLDNAPMAGSHNVILTDSSG